MKAIRRFLSPSDAKRERKQDRGNASVPQRPPVRSVSTTSHLANLGANIGRKVRPSSWHSAFSGFSGHSMQTESSFSSPSVSIVNPTLVTRAAPTPSTRALSQPSYNDSPPPTSKSLANETPTPPFIVSSVPPSQAGSEFGTLGRGVPPSVSGNSSIARSASSRISRSLSYTVQLSAKAKENRASRHTRPPRPRRRIDFAGEHPHIVTFIFAQASRSSLLRLRLVSKAFKEHADAQLATHLVISSPIGSTSLRVVAPGADEANVPGLASRVLWKKEERRRLSPVVSSTRVIDLCGPSRARDGEMSDITLQCSSVTTVRLRPDAAGFFPTVVPFPPRATQLVAFTSIAADSSATPTAADKAARRASWRKSWHDGLSASLDMLAKPPHTYIGPVPHRTRRLVVTVRYPKATLVQPPLRQLGTWHHPDTLREVVIIFSPQEPRSRPRPRSFLGLATLTDDVSEQGYEKYHLTSELAAQQAGSAARLRRANLSTPPSSTPPSNAASPATLVALSGAPPLSPGLPTPLPTPTLTVSDADAEGTSFNFPLPPSAARLGVLSPLIRAMARHLPHVSYTLVDATRLDPAVLGQAPGTLLSPRQVEREITSAVRQEWWAARQAEGWQDGWGIDSADTIVEQLKFVTKDEYVRQVGETEWKLETSENMA